MHPKILADENVDYRIIKELRKKGFNVISVLDNYKGIPDKEVLGRAIKENSLLLTEDSDFGEWIFVHKEKNAGVIFLRYKPKEIKNISDSLIKILTDYGNSLYRKFVVVTVKKIRIRDI